MQKRAWLGILSVLALCVALFSWPSSVSAAGSAAFTGNLTVGNAAPTITWVQTGLSVNPIESTTRTLYVAYNVTDLNGFADVNYTSGSLVVSMAGEQTRRSTAGTCIAYNNASTVMQINCSVALQYYDLNGSWSVNVSVRDYSSAYAENTSTTFEYGVLAAVTSTHSGITFGSVALGSSNNGATNDPLLLNNTGNQNFTSLNITAYEFRGQTTTTEIIGMGNFTSNATADGPGQTLVNGTDVGLTGGSLTRDVNGIDTNESVYFYVSIPAAGLSPQNYLSVANWVLEPNI